MNSKTTTMSAPPISGSDAGARLAGEYAAARKAGWRRADLDWERLQEDGNALLRSGDRAGAARCFRRAGWAARRAR